MFITENISFIDVAAGLVIIGLGIVFANVLGKLSEKILKSFEIEKVIKKFPIGDLVGSVVKFLVYIISIVWGVFQMGIQWIVLIVICAILVIIMIWKVIMGIKDFFPNYLASSKLKKGRATKLLNLRGRIKKVKIICSVVKLEDGEILYVPNKLLRR